MHEGRAAMGRVLPELHQAGLPRLVHHPLDELPAEILSPRQLGHREVLSAAELVQDVAHPDAQTAELLVELDPTRHPPVHGAEGDIDLGEAVSEKVGVERSVHPASMTPWLSYVTRHDTLVVMISTIRTLDLADQRITFVEHGSTAAPALLLLHGGAVDRRMWHRQLEAFPNHRVVAVDARGHGGSSDAERPYRLCDDVVALMDELEIEEAVLVGISMGGGTAVDVALEHPGRAKALVVGGTGTSEPEFTDPWVLRTFADWKAAELGGDLEAWVEVFQRFTAGQHRDLAAVDPEVVQLIGTMARDTVSQHLRLGADGLPLPPLPPTPVTSTWERLGRIRIPVLAVIGEHDGDDHREMGRRLAASVAGPSRVVEIPGAAHYPNLEHPVAFNRAVQSLLDES